MFGRHSEKREKKEMSIEKKRIIFAVIMVLCVIYVLCQGLFDCSGTADNNGSNIVYVDETPESSFESISTPEITITPSPEVNITPFPDSSSSPFEETSGSPDFSTPDVQPTTPSITDLPAIDPNTTNLPATDEITPEINITHSPDNGETTSQEPIDVSTPTPKTTFKDALQSLKNFLFDYIVAIIILIACSIYLLFKKRSGSTILEEGTDSDNEKIS